MFKVNSFVRFSIALALILINIYLLSRVSFIFQPLVTMITVITVPMMLSVFFYYLLRPLVNYMEKKKLNRTLSILLIYLVFGILFALFIIGLWPSLREQLINLVENAPNLINSLSLQLKELEQNGAITALFPEGSTPFSQITDYINKGFTFVTNYVSGFFSLISSFAIVLFTFPIILFYMLKQGEKFGRKLVHIAPKRFQKDSRDVVLEIDQALSGFIVGRVLVNLALGVLMYIGFLIIGLPYALLLTVIAVIMNFVPFIGAILSSVPIVIMGLVVSPSVAIWSLIIILVAQQIQDNLVAPYVFGKKLDIHPLTTIILVLGAGDLGGIIAILIIIPVYMIVKIILVRIYQLFFKDKWQNA
ncbi:MULTISPECIES: AI-2E family transporter [Paenibacillus]|uniref:AI-2E family transporter n=1 Tax=Paenibacillus TaxID=44249 RepID=UPI0007BED69B|nr:MULTISPECIES: AI-2E family transporter [Paenibacillus]OAX49187.1 AI-2 transport protein TqsA [Paenibacillus sp. AD87]WDQ30423.1 AI-2E family transporter [Paenibacillus marchantiae]SDK07602.1 Predicted PurR-regulated permease PerM [Paenibacillus sp. OK060]SEA39799.1 Predicted PurR-regulated permease PerM [Paenibacillus sp. 276b]SHN55295.1 Predicted PurR-regulated permease PerM [Paenibacillus sp. ov031]